jgi:hypothetical protein
LSIRNFLGIVWIVNFEGIIVDWEIAQRRVALGERATLRGAGNKKGKKMSMVIFGYERSLTAPVGALAPTH